MDVQGPRNRAQRSRGDVVDVAIRHYELGEPIENLAVDRGVDQSTIRRWLGRARREGIIRTLVVPPLSDEDRTTLRHEVRHKYELEDVVIVPGRVDVMDTADESSKKEALVIAIAQAAARYLENYLTNRDVLLVPWGRMANYIARQIKAPNPLPELMVVPMEGVIGIEYDPFEASILASSIASKFGGRSLLLPAPAVIDSSIQDTIESLPLVKRVSQQYADATVAIVPIAPPDPKNSTVVRTGLMEVKAVEDLVDRGAVGEIASHWWFDSNGGEVEQGAIHAVGLGLDGLTNMVRRRAKAIGVVGASRERIEPLRVALENKLVNVLITDHVTAEILASGE
ncbi:MAG: sugar-binding domain-containing protein [SAR202 cluster bacterium]|nr:sugar-binding domain-containing protein [SAR202 cluster bacterium]MDP6300863.1 sugar-binding domain-containing protein [SAR202 cluster bacterium]MDP7104610.1 sugar-binding domain-containing protein [SAR202 cluster bacterium]MDP7226275.1 sugar-binding domain-containing protein [SAR202 cluster bacterium]MDP7415142.1 sugar-binding domain-containing protein [SAR202 cluster bacterium]